MTPGACGSGWSWVAASQILVDSSSATLATTDSLTLKCGASTRPYRRDKGQAMRCRWRVLSSNVSAMDVGVTTNAPEEVSAVDTLYAQQGWSCWYDCGDSRVWPLSEPNAKPITKYSCNVDDLVDLHLVGSELYVDINEKRLSVQPISQKVPAEVRFCAMLGQGYQKLQLVSVEYYPC